MTTLDGVKMKERKRNAQAICQYCKKEFMTFKSEINKGKAKYCSISCGVAFRNKAKALSPQEIFFKNISKEKHPNDCWIYMVGARYGKMKIGEKTVSAHRYSYELHHGEVSEGKVICHKCDVKLCVNPEHLFIGTQKDNIHDMFSKNRDNRPKGSKHHNTKLNEEKVLGIKELLMKGFKIKEVAEIYKVPYSTISQIKSEKSWRHIKLKP
jgi:hypothetical protein